MLPGPSLASVAFHGDMVTPLASLDTSLEEHLQAPALRQRRPQTVGSGPQDQWTRSPDPQRANRRYTRGQGDPPQFSRNWGNPWETIFWWGLGGNGHAQRPPGYHTIHLGQGKSPNLHFRNHSSTKPCFSGSILGRRNLPGPAGASLATQQILDNGRSRGYPGKGQG